MAEGIIRGGGGIADLTEATATKPEVLKGYTFYADATDELQTGTMINQSGTSIVLKPEDTGILPAGYHDGTGIITVDLSEQTATVDETLETATIYTPAGGGYILDNGNIAIRNADDININQNAVSVTADIAAGYYEGITKTTAKAVSQSFITPADATQMFSTDGRYCDSNIYILPYYTTTTPARSSSDISALSITAAPDYGTGLFPISTIPYGYYATNPSKWVCAVFDGSDYGMSLDSSGATIYISPSDSDIVLNTSGKYMPYDVSVESLPTVVIDTYTFSVDHDQVIYFDGIDFEPEALIVFSSATEAGGKTNVPCVVYEWSSQTADGIYNDGAIQRGSINASIGLSDAGLSIMLNDEGYYWALNTTYTAIAIKYNS